MFFQAISQLWDDFTKPTYVVTTPQRPSNHKSVLYSEFKRTGIEAGRAHMTLYTDGSYKAGIGGKAGYGECKIQDFEAYPGSALWHRSYPQPNKYGVEDVYFLSWATVRRGKDGKRELHFHKGQLPREIAAKFGAQSNEGQQPKQPIPKVEGFQRRCLTVIRDRY